ncbi:MAG: leucyl aminopeptidase family protein, partial [Sphingorhabdus sp.]
MMRYDEMIQPDNGQPATLIHIVDKESYASWHAAQPDAVRAALRAQKFDGSANGIAILPGEKPGEWAVAAGVTKTSKLGIWNLAKAADSLAEGTYRLANVDAGDAMLGWILGQYRYHEYISEPKLTGARILLVQEPGRIQGAVQQARATALVRDLVNRPAGDMGPSALEFETKRIAKLHKAQLVVTQGTALETGFP